MIDNKICNLCGGRASKIFDSMNGYVEGKYYDVLECKKCKTSFVSPMDNLKEEYEIIYGGDSNKDSATDFYHYLAKAIKEISNPFNRLLEFSAIFWSVCISVLKYLPRGSKILEVGSGLGYFTYALSKKGYDAFGIDYSDTAVIEAKKMFGDLFSQGTLEEFVESNSNKFDAVIAMELIEHIVDPDSFVKNSLQILKPGGVIIITTPIKDIHPKGVIWETEPAPIHLWWYTKEGMRSLAKKNKASISFVDFTDYTKKYLWKYSVGVPFVDPNKGPVVDKNHKFIVKPKVSYKTLLMKIIPAWVYMYLVIFYHKLKFLGNEGTSKNMYGMCAIIKKMS